MNTTLFQILQIIQLKVISYLDTDHLPFLEKGEGVDGWHDKIIDGDIYNIRTLSVNIKCICTSFRNRQNSEPSASFSCLFRSEYKWILYLTIMYVYCVYPAMSKKSDKYETGTNVTRNTKKTPLTAFMKGEEWRLFLSFLLKSDKFSDFFDIAG
jgi:hypothetical protein